MQQVEEFFAWIIAGLVSIFMGMIAYIFNSFKHDTKERLLALEADAVSFKAMMAESFETHNKEDIQRHDRDRRETKEDLERVTNRFDEQTTKILERIERLHEKLP